MKLETMKIGIAAVVVAGCVWCASAAGKIPALQGDAAFRLKTMAENIYGVRPDFKGFVPKATVVSTTEDAAVGGIKKVIRLNTMTPLGEKEFDAIGYFPKGDKKVPVFVNPLFKMHDLEDGSCPVKYILERGVGVVIYDYNTVLKDDKTVLNGITRKENDWGAISTWAFANSRIADYLQTDPQADAAHLGVIGHSRLGKTAMWTGATDTRFAYVCPNNSGCLGARLSTRNVRGETIKRITTWFPHWFAPKAATFADKDDEMPFDQHWALSTIAPRLLHIGSADQDWWACPSGEFAAFEVTKQAYGDDWKNIGYHVRHGDHAITPEDWKEYLDFAKSHGWDIR